MHKNYSVKILRLLLLVLTNTLLAQTYNFTTSGDVEGFVIHTEETTVTQTTADGTDGIMLFTMPITYNPTSMRVDQLSGIDATNNKYMIITLKNNTDIVQLRLRPNPTAGFIPLVIDANTLGFNTYVLNMSNYADWTGDLDNVYFQFRIPGRQMQITGTSIEIDQIVFNSSGTLSSKRIVKNDPLLKLNIINKKLIIDTDKELLSLEVFNILGKRIIKSNTNVVDLANLAQGVYVAKAFNTSGLVSTKRFVVY